MFQRGLSITGLVHEQGSWSVEERHTSNVRSVVTATVLAKLRDLGDLLGSEFDFLEVGLDTRRSDRLGDDTVATDLGPGKATERVRR